MTQPTDGEIWKMCDTEEGSISLSYSRGQLEEEAICR